MTLVRRASSPARWLGPQTPVEPRFEDRVIFSTPIVRVGAFRCDRDHPTFQDTGPIENYCFVFPRTAVIIEHEHERPFVANSTVATLYNRSQQYRRHRVSEAGDQSDWFGVDPLILRDVMVACGVTPRGAEQLFPVTHAPVDGRTYMFQRRIFEHARARPEVEPLAIEENVLILLERLVRDGIAPDRKQETISRRQLDLVREAEILLSRTFERSLSLEDVARRVNASEYHLCRLFRRATGRTLHRYRHELRLRESLRRIGVPQSTLIDVALGLGFSSHSHFTEAFRGEFGEQPSRFRDSIGVGPVLM